MLLPEANRGAMWRIALPRNPFMSCSSVSLCIFCLRAFACAAASSSARTLCRDEYGVSTQRQQSADTKQGSGDDSAAARLTRGKKLMLKAGSFQPAPENARKGDGVRKS